MSDQDVVTELDVELALIEQLPYRVPIHVLARRARDEIVALKRECAALAAVCEEREDTRHSLWRAKQARAEAFEEVARIMDQHRDKIITGTFLAWAIRALKDKP